MGQPRRDKGLFPVSSLPIAWSLRRWSRSPVLAMAAGATRRIGLMTSVVIGPTRETTLVGAGKPRPSTSCQAADLTLGNRHWRARERLSRHAATDFHRRGKQLRRNRYRAVAHDLWSGAALSDDIGAIGPTSPRPKADPKCSSAVTCRRSWSASPSGATATWRPAAASRKRC